MPRLKAYHRPTSVADALRLLARADVNCAVVAGGTYINAHMDEQADEVVDLQAVAGLDRVDYGRGRLTLGATVRLQSIVDDGQAPALLREAARREGPNTLRNAATVGGVVVGGDRESELLAALLVFEAEVTVQSLHGVHTVPLADFWAGRPELLANGLVTAVTLATDGSTADERVARTPADRPIVAALGRLDGAGRVHLALCGVARTPLLVDPERSAASLNPPGDFRGSGRYRREMAVVLAKRVLDRLGA